MESSASQRPKSLPSEKDDKLVALQESEKEKSNLLLISDEISRIRKRDDLLTLINGRLKELLPFHHGGVGLINSDKKSYFALLFDRSYLISNNPLLDEYFREGFPINTIINKVLEADRPVIFDLDELFSSGELPLLTRLNYEAGMKEMVIIALQMEEKCRGGFFGVFSSIKNKFNKNQLRIFQAVSNQLSVAVANILANEELLERENEKSMLLSLSEDITMSRTYEDVQYIVSNKLAKYYLFHDTIICLKNSDNLTHESYAQMVTQETMNHPDFERKSKMKFFTRDGIFNVIEGSKEPVIFDMEELAKQESRPFYIDFWHKLNVKELIGFPMWMNNECIGVAKVYSRNKNTFPPAALKMAQAVTSFIGTALFNIRSLNKIQSQLEEINKYKSQLERENEYLQEQVKTKYNYEEIIGLHNGLKDVFQLVTQVAPSDSTVLLSGETGTGKELIAEAIHHASPRRNKLMVKLNCAALPANLVESELFGHEKGSFTGAIERRIGKFELANNGTLFLDEIGELTLELQAKLLRALQEKEIERVGGKSVIKVDARIITASNRDLWKEVEAGRFRSDLFYRLNVFPITIPALRNRKEDIPMLVAYFLEKFSKRSGKKVKQISAGAVKDLMLYDWPGNVRELEHVIERNILIASGDTITTVSLPQLVKINPPFPDKQPFRSLEENERAYIILALKKTNGRIRGAGGAAELLKIPPTTLHSKIKKLGIRKNAG
jgi:formate hydrogenlyase transcriptional activator